MFNIPGLFFYLEETQNRKCFICNISSYGSSRTGSDIFVVVCCHCILFTKVYKTVQKCIWQTVSRTSDKAGLAFRAEPFKLLFLPQATQDKMTLCKLCPVGNKLGTIWEWLCLLWQRAKSRYVAHWTPSAWTHFFLTSIWSVCLRVCVHVQSRKPGANASRQIRGTRWESRTFLWDDKPSQSHTSTGMLGKQSGWVGGWVYERQGGRWWLQHDHANGEEKWMSVTSVNQKSLVSQKEQRSNCTAVWLPGVSNAEGSRRKMDDGRLLTL